MIVFEPTLRAIAVDAVPEVTVVPFTLIVELAWWWVGVT